MASVIPDDEPVDYDDDEVTVLPDEIDDLDDEYEGLDDERPIDDVLFEPDDDELPDDE